MIAGRKPQHLAEAFVLRGGGFRQRHIWPLEIGARIHQCFIEEERKEIVAEVVMRGDVAAAAARRVVAQPMARAQKWARHAREAALLLRKHFGIADVDDEAAAEIPAIVQEGKEKYHRK